MHIFMKSTLLALPWFKNFRVLSTLVLLAAVIFVFIWR